MKLLRYLACLLLVVAGMCGNVQGQIITTIAGNGIGSFGGDGGPATNARFDQFVLVGAVDGSGNIFTIDEINARIRKIDNSGIISTVAGGGMSGLGDGGPATAAQISARGIAVDRGGILYVAEGARIRRVNTSGVISTIIGDGISGFSGDGGLATAARVSIVSNVVVDTSGNVIFVDVNNYRIRKISTSGIVSTIAGNGSATYSGDGGAATAAGLYFPPYSRVSLCIDSLGNIYTNDTTRIRMISVTGIINTFVSGLMWPFSFVVKSPRAIFYSPQCGIFKGDTSGTFSRIAGGGSNRCANDGDAATAIGMLCYQYFNIYVDAQNNVYTLDILTNCVVKIDSTGIVRVIAGGGTAGLGDGGPATAAQLYNPNGIVMYNDNIFVTDYYNQRVRKINSIGVISTIAGTSLLGDCGDGGAASLARLNNPNGLTVNSSGEIFASVNSFVKKVSSSGIITTVAGSNSGYWGDGRPATDCGMSQPKDVCFDRRGNLYISEFGRITKVDTSGMLYTIVGSSTSFGFSGDGGPATAAEIYLPCGMSTDTFGNLYIADGGNHRIRKVDIYGYISTFAGNGYTDSTGSAGYSGDGGASTAASLNWPSDIKFDKFGNCYVADGGNNRIRKINRYGIISTIAGNGSSAFTGDGGPATAAGLGNINRLCIDSALNIYLTEGYNCVRKISATYVAAISGSGTICIGASSALTDSTSGGSWSLSNPSVATINATSGSITGVLSGTTTVFYYTGTGVASRIITVIAPPNAGTISGPSTVCEASTITLSDTATGGTWSSSNTSLATVNTSGIVTGVTAGTVIISYTKTNSCGSRSAVDTIRVLPLPHSGTITGSTTLCPGATLTLTDTTSGGTWSSSSTSLATVNSSGVVTGIAAGSVTISYTVTNSCGTSVAIHAITVNPSPVAGTLSGAAIVCLGVTDTLTMTGGTSGGTWTSSATGVATVSAAGVVHGVSGGTTTISYTVTNSCGGASATRSVAISPFPTVAAITGASAVCPGATRTLSDATTGGAWSSSSTSVATISASGVVTGVSGGTTLISYTVTNSCGSTSATVTMAVNPLPTAGTITGATTLCEGTTIPLADTALSGVWSSSNTTLATVDASGDVNGLVAGTDTIYYTVTFYCGSAVAMQVITVNPLPDPGTISGASTVCPGNTVTLTNPATSGTWSSDATGTATISATGTVTGVSTGTCNISYTVTNSCGTANATYPMTVLPLASCPSAVTITAPTKNKFSIYPNPAKEVFTVLVSSPFDEQLTIRITNVTGQLVKEFSGTTNQPSAIQLSQPSGVYFVTAITSRDRFVGEVVIAKQ